MRILLFTLSLLCPLISFSQAKQFVLFDQEFTYTKHDADNSSPSKSHYYVTGNKINPDRPKDWTSPVDYRNGTVHIKIEVLEKPEVQDIGGDGGDEDRFAHGRAFRDGARKNGSEKQIARHGSKHDQDEMDIPQPHEGKRGRKQK